MEQQRLRINLGEQVFATVRCAVKAIVEKFFQIPKWRECGVLHSITGVCT